ncbi:single-stranded DNA-binding protein [Granulicatella seriolae]|uniref:Single-stranded DNA-binding protein n=1 Tax=Granulicatella seriolae TaxID=2967226 RepID=A0ABT1WNU3_9LACT|nr:single-stranded DNA-binding protein [Granulicatella seriolae]
MNLVGLIGRVVRPVELQSVGDTVVLNNTLAVQNIHKSNDEGINAEFIPFVAWGKVAQRIKDYVEKGHKIGVSGHLNTRSYTNKQNQQVFVMEVVVEDVFFLEARRPKDMMDNPFVDKQKVESD